MCPAPFLALQVGDVLPTSVSAGPLGSSSVCVFLSLRKDLRWFLQSLNLVATLVYWVLVACLFGGLLEGISG